MTNWKKEILSIKKDENDRNVKIEAALNAQGRKTTIPHEAHEALHTWWQTGGKSSLSPSQQQKLAEIKAPKERRAQMKIVKDDLENIAKSLSYLKEAVLSPLFKEEAPPSDAPPKTTRSTKSVWQPSREYSSREMSALQPHIDNGHSLQEAAHLSGVDRTAQNHPHQMPVFSPTMTAKAKAAAMDWIGRSKQMEAQDAKPEINPEKYIAGKAAEASATSQAAAKSYGDMLKEHKANNQHLSPDDLMASVQAFKADYHNNQDGAGRAAHLASAKTRADTHAEAKDARSKELYESRKNIVNGQDSGEKVGYSEESPLTQEDMDDIHSDLDEGNKYA